MRKLLVITLVGALVCATVPGPALAQGSWNGAYYGGYGWWGWPGAIIGGVVLGAAALVTAPFWVLSAALPYAPPPAYPVPRIYAAPLAYAAPPSPVATVRREVVYPTGRYVLYGDGVHQPWQWVWVPSALPLPPPPPGR